MVVIPRSRSRRRGFPGVSGTSGAEGGGSATGCADAATVVDAGATESERTAVDGGVVPISTGELVTDLTSPVRRGVIAPATKSAADANELEREPKKLAARRDGEADTGAKNDGCQVASIESFALVGRGE